MKSDYSEESTSSSLSIVLTRLICGERSDVPEQSGIGDLLPSVFGGRINYYTTRRTRGAGWWKDPGCRVVEGPTANKPY